MRKLLRKYDFVPDKLVTDDLRSYGAAASDLGMTKHHERGRWRIKEGDDADDIFVKLMGDIVEPRREFIQENALNVANLDV